MIRTSIIVEGGFPSLNDVIRDAKKHHMAYAKLKKEHTERVERILIDNNCVPLRPYDDVCVSFLYGETKKRRDPDNITVAQKFILDAMVNVGMIEDDTRDHVLELNHRFRGAPQKERSVLITWYGGYHNPE